MSTAQKRKTIAPTFKDNIIMFTEVTARAEKLKQQKAVNKEIQEAEAKKSEAIKEFIATLDELYFSHSMACLLADLTRVATTGYSLNKVKAKREALDDANSKRR